MKGKSQIKALTLAATNENRAEMTAFIDEQLEACDSGMKAQMRIDIAHYTCEDSGIPFAPMQRPDPDITLSAEKRRIGGRAHSLTRTPTCLPSRRLRPSQRPLKT